VIRLTIANYRMPIGSNSSSGELPTDALSNRNKVNLKSAIGDRQFIHDAAA